MNHQRLLTILLVGMLLSACAQFTPYRTEIPLNPEGVECVVSGTPEESLQSLSLDNYPPCEDKDSDNNPDAIQHRSYTESFKYKENGEDKEDEKVKRDYYLSFVEFDDQGWFAEREQMVALFALLDKLKKDKQETLIYVYAHGWKHNAKTCDNNIVCFSRSLERMDLMEKKLLGDDHETQRAVVGVYLGWRGLPFDSALNNLSFWSRKNAAARVGRGGVFELLTKLKDYRDDRQKAYCLVNEKKNPGSEHETLCNIDDPNSHATQLIITGHSFGGLVIYEALSHALMERAAKITKDADGKLLNVKSFGDFVMLVNPAFEGSLYEPLFQIATDRKYPDGQRPVMMIVTSDADSATKYAFPIGRGIGTLLQHAGPDGQSDSMLQTIGHNDRYVTHVLQDKKELSEEDRKKIKKNEDKSDCGCKYLIPTAQWNQESMLNPLGAFFAVNSGTNDYSGDEQSCESKAITLTSVSSKTTYPQKYPYLVVKTHEKLIPDHNTIYEDRFTTFAQVFTLFHALNGYPLPTTPAKPCPAPTQSIQH